MIFVTVGAQMPFDRLVRAVDAWAEAKGRFDVFAQIGNDAWQPRCIAWQRFLEPDAYRGRIRDADAVVAHAGTGSILTALELGRPILVMPRRGDLGETRNDHQFATAERFGRHAGVVVAASELELPRGLAQLEAMAASPAIGSGASPALVTALRDFLDGEGR